MKRNETVWGETGVEPTDLTSSRSDLSTLSQARQRGVAAGLAMPSRPVATPKRPSASPRVRPPSFSTAHNKRYQGGTAQCNGIKGNLFFFVNKLTKELLWKMSCTKLFVCPDDGCVCGQCKIAGCECECHAFDKLSCVEIVDIVCACHESARASTFNGMNRPGPQRSMA
jgi:hypothetical protein